MCLRMVSACAIFTHCSILAQSQSLLLDMLNYAVPVCGMIVHTHIAYDPQGARVCALYHVVNTDIAGSVVEAE